MRIRNRTTRGLVSQGPERESILPPNLSHSDTTDTDDTPSSDVIIEWEDEDSGGTSKVLRRENPTTTE